MVGVTVVVTVDVRTAWVTGVMRVSITQVVVVDVGVNVVVTASRPDAPALLLVVTAWTGTTVTTWESVTRTVLVPSGSLEVLLRSSSQGSVVAEADAVVVEASSSHGSVVVAAADEDELDSSSHGSVMVGDADAPADVLVSSSQGGSDTVAVELVAVMVALPVA